MSLEAALSLMPTFVLAFFRLAAMFLSAPLFGSARVPRRVKILFALALTAGITPALPPGTALPSTAWGLAAGIAGEMVFGLALGTALSVTFVAVSWAGEIIGQQMGFNLGEVFDPAMGGQTSVIGDLYFMLTLVTFMLLRGHHALLRGVVDSFQTLPLLSVGMNTPVFDLMLNLLSSATMLAMQLAAPVLITLLVVDLILGFIGKTMPQMNVMAAGLSLRSMIGLLVLAIGLSMTSETIAESLADSLRAVGTAWRKTVTTTGAG